MKKLILFVCFMILAKPVLPVAEYVINYEYISTKLCVNKEKPKLHCNGKCQLMKKLAAASEGEKPISSDKKANPLEHHDWIDDVKTVAIPVEIWHASVKTNTDYHNFYRNLRGHAVFHPPTVIS